MITLMENHMPTQESSIPQKETPKKSIQYTDLSFPSLLLPKTFTRAVNDICEKLTAEKSEDGQSYNRSDFLSVVDQNNQNLLYTAVGTNLKGNVSVILQALHKLCDDEKMTAEEKQSHIQSSVMVPSHFWKSMITPLHLAARGTNTDICHMLIDAGALANAKDSSGQTPLHHAAEGSFCHPKVIELLLRSGADINATNDDGQTPMDVINSKYHGTTKEQRINSLLGAYRRVLTDPSGNDEAITDPDQLKDIEQKIESINPYARPDTGYVSSGSGYDSDSSKTSNESGKEPKVRG